MTVGSVVKGASMSVGYKYGAISIGEKMYDDCIKIIDYKLKNIDDENYLKQLMGYKTYIENKTKKDVSIYLYFMYYLIVSGVPVTEGVPVNGS